MKIKKKQNKNDLLASNNMKSILFYEQFYVGTLFYDSEKRHVDILPNTPFWQVEDFRA